MNSGARILESQQTASAEPDWSQQFQNWRDLLAECGRKPSRRRVHALRVATLRLSAEVDHWLEGHETELPTHRAAKRWSRQAKKLRRVLSEVRETDVHLGKLAALPTSLAAPVGYRPRSSKLALRQLAALQRTLKQERGAAAKRLTDDIKTRRDRLEKASRAIELSIAIEFSAPVLHASAVVKMFHMVVLDFPSLDSACLHDFRKRIKGVRYQAELFAHADPHLQKLAVVLKTMQGATGDWHDCLALAELSTRRFRRRTKNGGLTELLETLTQESLQKALELCERQLAPYREAASIHEPRSLALPPKKSPTAAISLNASAVARPA
ncbi:MAG: CHAD domain-containing protein [Terracidiphilus sp.]